MKKGLLPFVFLAGLLVLIRISNDPELMLVTADSLSQNGEYDRAITLYEMIIPSFRGKKEAELIAFNLANSNYLQGRYILSSHYFKAFADTYGTSQLKEEALYKSAISYYRLSPRYQLDQSESERAVGAFETFINTYPSSDKVDECNEFIDELRKKMEEKAFHSGRLYYNRSDYSSAITDLENLLKDYPDTKFAEEARYLIVRASIDWADRSIYTKKEERYRKALLRCESYLKRHSTGEKAEEVLASKDKCDQELKILQNG